jgi:hypothetical protein
VVVSDPGNTLLKAVHEAVDFWNAELSSLSTPFRLGSVNHIVGDLTAKDYCSPQEQPRSDPFPPKELRQIDGDVIVTFHNHETRSCTPSWRKPNNKALVAIARIRPSASHNLVSNIVAHELGHAIGLGHTAAPNTLMCGTPARCYVRAPKEGIIPLTVAEKTVLSELYPSSWKADPPGQPGAG